MMEYEGQITHRGKGFFCLKRCRKCGHDMHINGKGKFSCPICDLHEDKKDAWGNIANIRN